jgi:hypothetical protein
MAEQNIPKTAAPKTTSEHFWLIVGGVAAVAAVIVAIYGFYFTHHEASKGIEAILISRSQLLNPEVHKKPSELHLLYKDHEIFDLGILQIRIQNDGAQPITKADIEEPITIAVEGATEIVSAPVVETRPPNLHFETTISGKNVELNKSLLNPNDTVTVEIDAIATERGKIDISEVSGRIAGVQNIVFHKSLPQQTQTISSGVVYTGIIIGGLAFILSAAYSFYRAYQYRVIERYLWDREEKRKIMERVISESERRLKPEGHTEK